MLGKKNERLSRLHDKKEDEYLSLRDEIATAR